MSGLRYVDGRWWFKVGGDWRALKDPEGPASPAQLARLNREGRLAVVRRGEKITKLDAARLIDGSAG